MFKLKEDDSILKEICILIIFISLFVLLNAFGVWLWNTILVSLFGVPIITFWKFMGLQILIRILSPTSCIKLGNNDDKKRDN